MSPTAVSAKPLPWWANLVTLVVTYAAWKLILVTLGFRYRLFGDPFDLGKFLVDFGIWAVLYLITIVAVRTWYARRESSR